MHEASYPAAGTPAVKVTIQRHTGSRWTDMVDLDVNPSGGYHNSTRVCFAPGAKVELERYMGTLPGQAPWHSPTWPPFVLDLLPQWGRSYLTPPSLTTDDPTLQLGFLLQAGGSPIGNLRVKGAFQGMSTDISPWTEQELFRMGTLDLGGLLAKYAPAALGVQGAWPKFMVAQCPDGTWKPDCMVSDVQARNHAIVKWAADPSSVAATVLACEPAYVELARWFGLRCQHSLVYRNGTLLIPRFDRSREAKGRLRRYAQMSLAAAVGRLDFGVYGSHENYLAAIAARCTNPGPECAEYVLRDLFNMATGNVDNHGRNTALQWGAGHGTTLSPVYDLAPMCLMMPDEPRATTWADEREEGSGLPDWSVRCQATTVAGADVPSVVRRMLAGKADMLRALPRKAVELGVPPWVVEVSMGQCDALARQVAF